jgi:hypothetical protein
MMRHQAGCLVASFALTFGGKPDLMMGGSEGLQMTITDLDYSRASGFLFSRATQFRSRRRGFEQPRDCNEPDIQRAK